MYTKTPIPIVTSKLGPSGSLKNTNIILENTIAVIAKIINKDFFDVKFIFVIILKNLYDTR